MIDTRLAVLLLWGGGVVILGAIVLVKRWRRFTRHRNDRRRSVRADVRRDVLSGFALFLAAFGSAVATALVLFGEPGTSFRGFFTALALGAFVGALFVMATEEDANGYDPTDTGGYDGSGDH